MFVIEDDIHCETVGEFASRADAVAELRRLAEIAWDQTPNVAPCVSWRTCGREYLLIEYDAGSTPWRTLNNTPALNISPTGMEWLLAASER